MHSALLNKALESVRGLEVHIEASRALRAHVHTTFANSGQIDGLDEAAFAAVDWKILDHCLVTTRLYAIFEHFCHELLKEHLSFLEQYIQYNDLNPAVKDKHRIGVSKILQRVDSPRYTNVDISGMVMGLERGLRGLSYKLEPFAMLIHEQNLRLPILETLMRECGINELRVWLDTHPALKSYLATSGGDGQSPEGILHDLIEFRNNAAHHGMVVDEVLSDKVLLDLCDFVTALMIAMAEKVASVDLDILLGCKKAFLGGKVTDVYKKADACVVLLERELHINDSLFIRSGTRCRSTTVQSLQLNGQNVQSVTVGAPIEVGLKLSFLPMENDQIIFRV